MSKPSFFGWHGAVALAVLFVLHHLLSAGWHRADPKAASQWGQNLIASESLVYEATPADCVIVGTSLSVALDLGRHAMSEEAPRFFNLAYAGGSLSTGLALIEASGLVPRCLVIETNFLGQPLDQTHIDAVLHPIWYPLKKMLPGFKHQNQPLNQLLTLMRLFKPPAASLPEPVIRPDLTNNAVYQTRLRGQLVFHDSLKPLDVLRQAEHLGRSARILASKGTQVFFLEMPVALEINAHPHYEVVRTALAQQNLMGHRNIHAVEIESQTLITTDGIHLNHWSQMIAERELFAAVAEQLELTE